MSDCKVPGCTWTNIYLTCQDGSREYAAYQHAQTHDAAAHSADKDAQAAWLAYRNEYARARYLTAHQVASQMRRREFVAGYLAALSNTQDGAR